MKKTKVFSASLISPILISAVASAATAAPEENPLNYNLPAQVPADTQERVIPVEQLSNFDFEAEIPTSGLNKYNDPLGQVTSVSQLSDVSPTDWAFQALQSLIERYGCISGYPDGTFRGNRAMTRYEFAAGVNQCLDRITELIAAATADVITRDDLAALERLQEEFAVELAEIDTRVDVLETRTAVLESQQFSTTTKLKGQVITYLADIFGEDAADENNTILQQRTRVIFDTSFTGSDTLRVMLQAGNFRAFDTATQFPEGPLSGGTSEAFLQFGSTGGDFRIGDLWYRFPIGEDIQVVFNVTAGDRIISEVFTPGSSGTTGAISYYARFNPIFYPFAFESGVGFAWKAAPWFGLELFAGSEFGAASDASLGLFDAGYAFSASTNFSFDRLGIAFSFLESYSPENGIDTFSGSNASKVLGAGPVKAHTYGAAVFYRFSPQFTFGSSVGFIDARTLGDGTKGNAHVFNYRFNFFFPDLFKEGNFAGLVVGTQPKLIHTSNDSVATAIGLPEGQRSDRDTGWHIEAFYTFQINDYGFIDIKTHSDFTLPINPKAESKVRQGVTTEIIGHCGFSVAPCLPGKVQLLRGYLSPSAPWLSFQEVDFPQYLTTFPSTSVNAGMLVGHNTLRLMVMGMDRRSPSREELEQMIFLLEEALDAGALGMSSGLFTAPGSYADREEIAELAAVLKRYNAGYFTHLRDESNRVIEAVNEAIEVGERYGVHVEIVHFKCSGTDNWGKVAHVLEIVQAARDFLSGISSVHRDAK